MLTTVSTSLNLPLLTPDVAPVSNDASPLRAPAQSQVCLLLVMVLVLLPCLRHQSCYKLRARHVINLSLFVGLTFAKCW